ncbi:MAG TPA: aromatic ring-hydroxylating dioxygenase subunit alpha [Bryobacteraceae bacterium]|nr:aromatic ring-hydroxylating dioxygenase subunit alpha [Bryobacteraceae bacterium]
MSPESDVSVLPAEWRTEGGRVPSAHFVSGSFARAEKEKLWGRVWQYACRVDEIPARGDFVVYTLVDQEFLVVRVDEATVKVYRNFCPHRGTALGVGDGCFSGGEIMCPFHGWRWNLKGENTFILDREGVNGGSYSEDDVKLREVPSALWAGLVFLNPDPTAAGTFDDFIAPLRAIVEPLELERMKLVWHKRIRSPANWKATLGAFQEGYHTQATHPEMARVWQKTTGTAKTTQNRAYFAYQNGHGRFRVPEELGQIKGTVASGVNVLTGRQALEGMIAELTVGRRSMECWVGDEDLAVAESLRDSVEERHTGAEVGAMFATALRDHYDRRGRFMAPMDELSKTISITVFPNTIFMPLFGNLLMYRCRPISHDPNESVFELFSLRTLAEGEAVPAVKVEDIGPHELPFLFRQDFGNIPRVQRGLRSDGCLSTLMHTRQEALILNLHHEVEKYLAR